MRIRLLVNIDRGDHGESRWQREVDRPYPGVPRPDEWVYLGESEDGDGMAATPVAVVTWAKDGLVTLRCDVSWPAGDPGPQMEAFGFRET